MEGKSSSGKETPQMEITAQVICGWEGVAGVPDGR